MASEAESLSRALLDVWNARDIQAFVDLLHEDILWYDCGMPNPPAQGKAAVRAFAEATLGGFPDFNYEIREPICVSEDGRRCVFPWRIRATASGWVRPPGFAPTNRSLVFEGMDLMEVREGRIVRIETFFDTAALAEQLLDVKLRPRPGGIGEQVLVAMQRLRAAWLRRFPRS